MTKNKEKRNPEVGDSILEASYNSGTGNLAGNPDNKYLSDLPVQDVLGRHTGIRAAQYCSYGTLRMNHVPKVNIDGVADPDSFTLKETPVPAQDLIQHFRSLHQHLF
jgi:hypothetical protein